MAINLRSGTYGDYYGSSFDSSGSLDSQQQEVNATYIYTYFKNKGWTTNAIAGMLGNMQAESSLNPGRWQSEDVGNTLGGYGLVQWTPASNYINWCSGKDASEMDNNLDRIIYELNNGLQYYATATYPETFKEFTQSTKSPSYLAMAFLKNYERAGVEVAATRQQFAKNWYSYLNGADYDGPEDVGSKKKKNKFKFILFNKRRRILL